MLSLTLFSPPRLLARLGLAVFTVLCAVLLATPMARAEAPGPDALIQSLSSEVIAIVDKNKDEIKGQNRSRIIKMVADKVTPHFNFMHMAKLAMARNWSKATPEQQKQIADEFRTLMIRTYSRALSDYDNQTIVVRPQRRKTDDTDVRVRSEIEKPGTQPISVNYDLEKTDSGWKIYDVEVAGASLVTSFRSTFNAEITNGGVEGLLKSLRQKNSGGKP